MKKHSFEPKPKKVPPAFTRDKGNQVDKHESPDTSGKKKHVLGLGGMSDKSSSSKTKSTQKEKVKAKPSLSKALMKYK